MFFPVLIVGRHFNRFQIMLDDLLATTEEKKV